MMTTRTAVQPRGATVIARTVASVTRIAVTTPPRPRVAERVRVETDDHLERHDEAHGAVARQKAAHRAVLRLRLVLVVIGLARRHRHESEACELERPETVGHPTARRRAPAASSSA